MKIKVTEVREVNGKRTVLSLEFIVPEDVWKNEKEIDIANVAIRICEEMERLREVKLREEQVRNN